jgi:hypothetical protein
MQLYSFFQNKQTKKSYLIWNVKGFHHNGNMGLLFVTPTFTIVLVILDLQLITVTLETL